MNNKKIKMLESATIIIDNDYGSIDIKESLDGRFDIRINDPQNIIRLGIPDKNSRDIYFIELKDIVKIIQDNRPI